MKSSKLALIALVTLFFACSGDDNNNSGPIELIPTVTANFNAIFALPVPDPAGDPVDITDLVNFGQAAGVSSRDWTVDLAQGDKVTLEQPTGLQAGDVLLYYDVLFENEAAAELYLEVIDCIEDPTGALFPTCDIDGDYVTEFAIRAFDASTTDIELKYDIICYVRRTGEADRGPFLIDPKIKIKSGNSQ